MPLTIAVYSDVVCPWCHLGKIRLEEGLKRAGMEDAEIVFLPFELNPDMPEEGMDRVAYLEAKFGPGRTEEIHARLDEAAAADGVRFNWQAVRRMPNTRKAHVLVALANGLGPGVGADVKGALMKGFFEEGRDVGDEAVLLGIGEAHGLTRMEMQAAFRDAALASEIGKLEDHARRVGVQGVPFFIIENRFGLSGAQSASVWAEALPQIVEEVAKAASAEGRPPEG